VWRSVKGMDSEHLAVAFNDVDLCLRIHQMGLKIIWTPDVVMIHHESLTRGKEDTPEKLSRFSGEVAFMKKRWGSILDKDPYWNPNLSRESEDGVVSTNE
jgi:GT2 family glycosyltransferase